MIPGKREIFVETVDMVSAGDLGDEVRIISRAIRRLGRNPRLLLYRGFNGEFLNIMLEHGTDTPYANFIYASPFDDLAGGGENPLDYAAAFDKLALACYDQRKMREDIGYRYFFKDPSLKLGALVGVLKLIYPGRFMRW